MSSIRRFHAPVSVLLLLAAVSPAVAEANVVWPGLILARGMVGWAILVGLLIEAVILRLWLKFPWRRAFVVAAAVNTTSALAGAFLTAAIGYAWLISPVAYWFYSHFDWSAFNGVSWIAAVVIAAGTSTVIELLALRRWWPEEGSTGGVFLFLGANIATTAVAVVFACW